MSNVCQSVNDHRLLNLQEFNPNLIGYASSDAFTAEKKSEFNVAEGGAMSRDLPFMAQILVKRMRNDPRVDLKNHWKVSPVYLLLVAGME